MELPLPAALRFHISSSRSKRSGEVTFCQLALYGLTIHSDTKILDLCCGNEQATKFLVKYSQNVIGLNTSALSLNGA
ncbi:hypothetical protein [Chlorogloeopsis sp. ULAP02]|uniref:hypothetical protein n=1 Tax=Chlorogloeopsis sp. ULAP02 TaxID=3107926 RepID=UPI00398AA18C